MKEIDKHQLAKQRFNTFVQKLNKSQNILPKEQHIAYLHLRNTQVIQDFYWTDHEITPTAFYRWTKTYNATRRDRSKWADTVVIDDQLYNTLVGMMSHFEPPLIMDDITVLSKSQSIGKKVT